MDFGWVVAGLNLAAIPAGRCRRRSTKGDLMSVLTIDRQTRVIITGGAGFLGTHLTRRLLSEGLSVTVLTRCTDSPRARAVAALGATVLNGDLTRDLAESSRKALPPQALFFHFAADTSVEGPGVWPANVDGTRRALTLAEEVGATQFVFASSIEAQGLARELHEPLTESDGCRPVSAYGRSKLEAERLVSEWGTQRGRRAAVLRIGNIYGPGSPWLLQSSLLLCLGKGSLRSAWEGLRHRAFQPLYVEDLVEAVARVAGAQLEGVYNITGDAAVSLESYLDHLGSLLGTREPLRALLRRSPASVLPAPAVPPDFAYFLMGDQEGCHRIYDNRKLVAAIGSYVRWSLPRGLAATLAWYRDSGYWRALLTAVGAQGGQRCTSR